MARGEGVYLFDTEGRRYLDFGGGIAVSRLGHAHPQAGEGAAGPGRVAVALLEPVPDPGRQSGWPTRLVENTFADTVFFGNSGAEACECGIKMVRKYHYETGHPDRFRIITIEGAFHGRTLATICRRQAGEDGQGLRAAASMASTRCRSAT